MKQCISLVLTSVMFYSCGKSLKNIDEGIESEEDVIDAYLTIWEESVNMMNQTIVHLEDLKETKKGYEDIEDAWEDVNDAMKDEKIDWDDLEDADNYEEYEDMREKIEDLADEIKDLLEDIELRDLY